MTIIGKLLGKSKIVVHYCKKDLFIYYVQLSENILSILFSCSIEKAANVCYQEFDVPEDFPVELHQYLPNVNYSHDTKR